ncbi:hypothetical protein B0H15DRAFT_35349 [Mycena belliarum]|uniref:Uncharacterized protein n=1 Tax=Mycena belliarum TaxID=1033014 RepID=A0AAD6XUU0_9AGAR|nr:hypothetical protein B0H15DRAFT_35349 [Mycena belliae]
MSAPKTSSTQPSPGSSASPYSHTDSPTNGESTAEPTQLNTDTINTSAPSSAPSTSSSTSSPLLAASKSKNQTPTIVGVLVPLVLLFAAGAALLLYKRRRRARDRREWERTHEAIADAVRQVKAPQHTGDAPLYGSRGTSASAWSHLDAASRTDLCALKPMDPFIEQPVAPGVYPSAHSGYVDDIELRPGSAIESASHLRRSHDLGP